jgi:two-component system nitrogen regulation sensor histidine kinase NtrY
MKRWLSRWRSPRLVTRLALAFGAVAALPLIVVPLVIHAVNDSYDNVFAGDLEHATRLVRGEMDRLSQDVTEHAQAVVNGSLLPEVHRRLEGSDGAPLVDLAGPALSESGLDILEVVDRDGRILLSGHLPARMGDVDEAAKKLLASPSPVPVLTTVEVKEGDEIRRALALVIALPQPAPLGGLIGGRLFSHAEIKRLGDLVRGDVTLASGPQPPTERTRRLGPWQWLRAALFSSPLKRSTTVPIASAEGGSFLRIQLSDSALMQTKWGIARGALLAFALALLAGGVLAALLARRIVGPVEALLDGTRRVAQGDLSHRVDVKASGEVGQLVVGFNDMASQLAGARDRLAHAERVAAWEQIARALAHEIKNPLTPIAMAIETLQRTHDRKHPEFDRFFKEGTATVLEEVGRLKRLATEFGEFARWPKPLVSPTAPAEIVRSIASLHGTLPPPHALDVSVEPELPNLLVDRDQLQRALVNLVKNALEAMPQGGTVTVRARHDNGGVAIEVADGGPGIPADAREKLFQPYYTTKPEGTGLGLPVVHRIVTEHQGHITIDETPGGGATFRLWLPAISTAAAVA